MQRDRDGHVTSVRWDIDRYSELQDRPWELDALCRAAPSCDRRRGPGDGSAAAQTGRRDVGAVLGGARGGVTIAVSREANVATPLPSRVTGVDEHVRPWNLARRQRLPATSHRVGFSVSHEEMKRATRICAGCPVRAEWFEHALARPGLLGTCAATTPAERSAIRVMPTSTTPALQRAGSGTGSQVAPVRRRLSAHAIGGVADWTRGDTVTDETRAAVRAAI
jgi:hypothetical protein